MTVKSIVEVQVEDGKFQRFKALFDRYQEQLAKTPNVWKSVGAQQAAMATQFERMTAAVMAQNALMLERKQDEARRLKDLSTTERLWTSISRNSSNLYRNVIGIGEGVLKWGGLLAGVAGGAGLFGIGHLARGVAQTRQQAMGFGVSPAQLQAFGVNFGRIVDPASYLSQVTTMETDVTQRRAWYALMGGRPMTGNTSADAIAFLNAARQFALRTPLSQLGTLAGAYGLPFSVEELMRMRGTGNAEWRQLETGAARDVGRFGLSTSAALAWQNLTTQFHRNRTVMFDQLALALGKLAGPLGQLSEGLTHAAVTLLGTPAVKQGITDLANWLKSFSGTLKSTDFENKLKGFAADVGTLASGMHVLAAAFRWVLGAGRAGVHALSWLGAAKASSLQTSGDWAWNLGSDIKAFFTGTPSLSAANDEYLREKLSAATLRQLDLAGVTSIARPIAATAPVLQGTLQPAAIGKLPPLEIHVMNATGGSAVVSFNSLAAGV